MQLAEKHSTAEPVLANPAAGPCIAVEVVGALLAVLNARDRETAEHSWRVARLCLDATRGRISSVDRLHLGTAALLHDIGKLGIPDWVLKKPGPLTEYEASVMRLHDGIGIDMLRSAGCDETVIEIVKNHSTSCNATLDPFTSHSVGARVLRIADAFDTLVSDHVYRLGVSQGQAFEELWRYVDVQFDSHWVEVIVSTVESEGWDHSIGDPSELCRAAATRAAGYLDELSRAIDSHTPQFVAVIAQCIRDTARGEVSDRADRLLQQIEGPADNLWDLAEELWDACWKQQLAHIH